MDFLNKKRYVFLLLALSGALTAFTETFPTVGFIEWVTLVPLAFVFYGLEKRGDAGKKVKLVSWYFYGIFFMMCHFLVIYHWFFYMYPLDFAGFSNAASLLVVLLAWIGLSAVAALPFALIFLLSGLYLRSRIHKKYGIIFPFFFASLWCVAEYALTLGWTGVPWGRLSLGQVKMLPMIQSASIFGSYFVSFLIVAVNFLIAYAFNNIFCRRLSLKSIGTWKEKSIKVPLIIAAALLIFNTLFGVVRLALPIGKTEEKVRVAAIQGNISSKEKWSDEALIKTLEVYRKYTIEASIDGAEVIIFPETFLPYPIFEEKTGFLLNYVSTLAKDSGATLLIGCFTFKNDDEYNSVVVCFPDGSFSDTVYSKRHLVPFAEYVPMRNVAEKILPTLSQIGMLEIDLSPGKSASVFALGECNIGSLICFDSIYEALTRDSVRNGAELIAISTNDSWFYDSAAVYMHNSQAQLRAVESGRYVIRAANTGISSIISYDGVIETSLPPLAEGYVIGDVTPRNTRTVYDAIGNLFVALCAAFCLSMIPICIFFREFTVENKIKS